MGRGSSRYISTQEHSVVTDRSKREIHSNAVRTGEERAGGSSRRKTESQLNHGVLRGQDNLPRLHRSHVRRVSDRASQLAKKRGEEGDRERTDNEKEDQKWEAACEAERDGKEEEGRGGSREKQS